MPKADGKTPEQRFHERYTIDPLTGCWNWTAGKSSNGSGYLWVGDLGDIRGGRGRTLQAYKLGWVWKNGDVPPARSCITYARTGPALTLHTLSRSPSETTAASACP